jgi:hypothetical protein
MKNIFLLICITFTILSSIFSKKFSSFRHKKFNLKKKFKAADINNPALKEYKNAFDLLLRQAENKNKEL